MPAGTGVWVVNTVLERTTVSAVSKSRPPSVTSSRMRSTPRKPAWPSFMWNTCGSGSPSTAVNARMARTPPMPARISCLIRCSWSPPYSRSVTPRRSCSVSGMSESKQQQRNSTDLRDPHPRVELGRSPASPARPAPASPVGVGEQPQRQTLRVERRVVLVLPAVGGQRLPEVARPVVQPDRDQRQPQVRRRLQVVAGQDAEATGVVRQHLGDAELHREVRDARRPARTRGAVRLLPGTTSAGSGSCPARRPGGRAGPGTSRRPPARRAASG